METEFQTSFIPKKALTEERVVRSKPVNFFTIIATIIFLLTIISAGGLYGYKSILNKKMIGSRKSLELAKGAFEPSLIFDLQTLDRRISGAKEVLNGHIIISPIFNFLQDSTLKSIRFTKFNYELGLDGKIVNVEMSGQSKTYKSIALQSDLYNQNKYIKDPVFSNLNLDEKGNVNFNLSFSVDNTFVSYVNTLEKESVSSVLPTNIENDLEDNDIKLPTDL